jgi:D-glycero-D-manno-heptose 1,7-bisphosphate phosphatase
VVKTVGRPAVFLDRDGVVIKTNIINGKPYAVRSVSEIQILSGVSHAIKELKKIGFTVVGVTNQPDIGNGHVAEATVRDMHNYLQDNLCIDAFKFCPHAQMDGCSCRKPEPGLLYEAANELSLELESSFMVGDRLSDIEAGLKAGCGCIFIDRFYAETKPYLINTHLIASGLPDAVKLIKNEIKMIDRTRSHE